ncbi:hypothetical protein EN848_33700, partial [bacterium M00.F.Ca.ET.205.01.1.1]
MKFRALLALALAAMCIVGGIGTWRAGTMLIAREPRQTLTAPGDLPVERIALDQPGTPELVGW